MGLAFEMGSGAAHRLPVRETRPEPGGPRVWAVGGGKGGVGKSVVTASIAMALGRRGQRCVVVDLDLGGANLHTLLGLRPPVLTLSHFLAGEVSSLGYLVCRTPYPNLSLVSSSRTLLDTSLPPHGQRAKILRHVRQLPVDEVFLDLSAGSHPSVVDWFLAAERGLVVVAPEPTAIENAYQFLKAAFFRGLRQETRRSAIRALLEQVLKEQRKRLRSPRELLAAVTTADPDAGATLAAHARAFAPALVVNQVANAQHRRIGWEMRGACREHLGAQIEYVGALERDECVRQAVREGKPVLERFPACVFSRSVEGMARRLEREEPYLPEPGTEDSQATYPSGRMRLGEFSLGRHGLAGELGTPPREEPAPVVRRATPPPPLDLERPGASLRRQREYRGLDLDEMERRTRIRSLPWMEQERFDRLPPDPYLRGQVLLYARALGIVEAELLAQAYVALARSAPA